MRLGHDWNRCVERVTENAERVGNAGQIDRGEVAVQQQWCAQRTRARFELAPPVQHSAGQPLWISHANREHPLMFTARPPCDASDGTAGRGGGKGCCGEVGRAPSRKNRFFPPQPTSHPLRWNPLRRKSLAGRFPAAGASPPVWSPRSTGRSARETRAGGISLGGQERVQMRSNRRANSPVRCVPSKSCFARSHPGPAATA